MFFKTWRNKYFRYFIISLICHIIIYILFFNVSFQKHSKTMIQGLWESMTLSPIEHKKRITQRQELFKKLQEIKQEKEQEEDKQLKDNGLPAKLRPKKSDFGWVFFDDSKPAPQINRVQVPTTEDGDVAVAPTPTATELIPEQPQVEKPVVEQVPVEQPKIVEPEVKQAVKEKPEQEITEAPQKEPEKKIEKELIKEQETPHKQKKSKEIKPKTEKQLKKELQARNQISDIGSLMDELNDSAHEEQPEQFAQVEAQENIQVFQEPAPVSAAIQARIDRIARRQEQVSNFAPTPAKNTGSVATAKVRGAKSGNKKESRGLIALTKGFVENLKDEGEDLIERDGDPNKRPSFEEMKYISYEANINWCLQAAWKQNFAYNSTARVRDGKAVIEFTINTKGAVTSSELLQSTGYPELDNLIMKNLSFASPFPPLPKHFGVDNYTTGRIIHVFCNNKFGL